MRTCITRTRSVRSHHPRAAIVSRSDLYHAGRDGRARDGREVAPCAFEGFGMRLNDLSRAMITSSRFGSGG